MEGSDKVPRPISTVSSIFSTDKQLPPSPPTIPEDEVGHPRTSSSVSSHAIHETAGEPPLEFYELPTPENETTSPLYTGSKVHLRNRSTGTTTPTGNRFSVLEGDSTPRQPPSEIAQQPPAIMGRSTSLSKASKANTDPSKSNAVKGDFQGWTSERDDLLEPSSKVSEFTSREQDHHTSSAGHQQATQAPMNTAKTLARKSLTRLRSHASSLASLHGGEGSNQEHTTLPQHPYAASRTTVAHLSASQHESSAAAPMDGGKSSEGDGNTIAQLYAVFGLPKDPSVWTLAEEDCVTGVQHMNGAVSRFWRPEVLGCSICPSPSEVLGHSPGKTSDNHENKWDGTAETEGKKSTQSPKFIEMSDGRGGVEKAETARVLSKALKLSFTREVEIVVEQGHYPPPSSSHTFSFSVPSLAASGEAHRATRGADGRTAAMAVGVSGGMPGATNGVGEGYGLEPAHRSDRSASRNRDEGPKLATFYGVVLTVWSAADEKRAKTIRKELSRAAKQRGQSAKASTGAPDTNASSNVDVLSSADHAAKLPTSTFFMPYAICIVSRYPLYNLLSDWNKMAWHKYSRNIEMHNKLMSTILRHPAPRFGEEISVSSPENDLTLNGTFPGALEWGTGLTGIDFALWPLFKTLSVDNILTICEIALGYNGRILFLSRHPALLGTAVETLRYLVEQSGWHGVAHQNCHARDVRIYLEDPGSWIIAIGSELRSLVDAPRDVCLVDLDINKVECAKPPPGSISKKNLRDKRIRKLIQAVFLPNSEIGPPRDYVEAYPGARFRPLSKLITRDRNSAYEQLYPPDWWHQTVLIQTIDRIFRNGSKQTFFKKVLKPRTRAVSTVSDAEMSAILALRKRASTFVDARDGLENKIGRLNKRLAFLMSESEVWRTQFGKIQVLVDRLTKEANDLRGKVDKERRESKRLSSTLAQRDIEHVQLQLQLKETESAREEALNEMVRMQEAMQSVDQEREAMMDEIRAVLAGGGNIDDVNMSIGRLDLPQFNLNPLSRSSSPTGSQVSMTPSQAADYIIKSRALAEARISEGRPGRALSRTASRNGSLQGHMRSMSQDRGELHRKASAANSLSSHVNHLNDEQMNYEIQQRTSVVTDQISRIQQQLESTLTNLEGRRSGTYERENERRLRSRRGSSTSLSSRYEYRSSLGHANNGAAESNNGHASEDGRSDVVDYEHIENVRGDKSENSNSSRRRRESRQHVPPPSATNNSLRVFPSRPSSQSGVQTPLIQPKSQARPQQSTNPWKEVSSTGHGQGVSNSGAESEPLNALKTDASLANYPVHTNELEEVQTASPSIESETLQTSSALVGPPTDSHISNGAAQPLLTAIAVSGNDSSGQHSQTTTDESGPKSPADVTPILSEPTTLTSDVPGNEVMPAPGGWTMEVEAEENEESQPKSPQLRSPRLETSLTTSASEHS